MIASILAAAAIATAPAAAPAPGPIAPHLSVITNPDWLKKPAAEDVVRYWPAEGLGLNGLVVIGCIATARGLLDHCEVVEEKPAGYGFGGAALLLAGMFEMRPKTVDGVPVGGAKIRIPIRFESRGALGAYGVPVITVANNIAWRETPTAADVAAAWPHVPFNRESMAHVVLECRVVMDGTLNSCEATYASPRDLRFIAAATRLARKFRAVTEGSLFEAKKKFYVNLPFDLRDPSQPAPPVELVSPQWLTGPDPTMAGSLFPAQAAKAGYKTGVGVVACQVTHEGRLADCSVSSENPANLGFGDAALQLAAAMTMNPWTKQGDPVDGARVQLPIRINLSPEPTAPAVAH